MRGNYLQICSFTDDLKSYSVIIKGNSKFINLKISIYNIQFDT